MWDLLFKQYASPFDFLDGISQMGMFEDGLINLLKQDQEKKMWELYLHSYPNCSFNEWKEKAIKEKPKELTQEEITTQVEMANGILKTFRIERGARDEHRVI